MNIDEIFAPRDEDFPFPVAEAPSHAIAPDIQVRRLLNRKSTLLQRVEDVEQNENEQRVTVTENGKPRTYTFRRGKGDRPVCVGDVIVVSVDKMANLTITKPTYFKHGTLYYGL